MNEFRGTRRGFHSASLVAGLSMVFAGAYAEATDKSAPENQHLQLENRKLTLEIEKLRDEAASPLNQSWVAPLSALLGGTIASGLAWWVARRGRLGSFDQELLVKRLERYPALVAATESLALYFQPGAFAAKACRESGEKLRTCYFSGTGILISEESRDCYFRLMEALTLAADAEFLDMPAITDYRPWISEQLIGEYRHALGLEVVSAQVIASWSFGQTAARGRQILYRLLNSETILVADLDRHPEIASAEEGRRRQVAAAHLFRDFVLLQFASSQLRTALAEDLRGRRRPA